MTNHQSSADLLQHADKNLHFHFLFLFLFLFLSFVVVGAVDGLHFLFSWHYLVLVNVTEDELKELNESIW